MVYSGWVRGVGGGGVCGGWGRGRELLGALNFVLGKLETGLKVWGLRLYWPKIRL